MIPARIRAVLLLALVVTAALGPGACRAAPRAALRRIEARACAPELKAAFDARGNDLLFAIDRSIEWLDGPGSRESFPFGEEPVTHERARESLIAMKDLLRDATSSDVFAEEVLRRFDVYESTGRDGRGNLFFTGYYAPEYAASREAVGRYRHALYGPPPFSLTRREIVERDLLAGREIAWLEDPLDAYLAHVNGSARLRLPDGTALHVGHAGTNDRPYTSLGALLVAEGLATEDEMSMQTIRRLHERYPERVEALMLRNDRFVFFDEIPARDWPRGGLGMKLTPEASLATDRSLFPPGGVVLVATEVRDERGVRRPFVRFMLDQDQGAAIRTPGRADLYMGAGDRAGEIAGRLRGTGRLCYLFLKPDDGAR